MISSRMSTKRSRRRDAPLMTMTGHRNLLTDPLWRAEDLGKPIPDSPDAVSVALPTWDQVVGYEEGRQEILDALSCGYPRFCVRPSVQELFDACVDRFGKSGDVGFAFPSESVALRCRDFIARHDDVKAWIEPYGNSGVFGVIVPEGSADTIKEYWQHSGEIVSSRRARAALHDTIEDARAPVAEREVREHIASWTGADATDVFLYPSGMAALADSQRMLHALRPDRKSVQLGFPYVDLLKLQQKIGPGVYFFPEIDAESVDDVCKVLESEEICGLFTEFPGNPLLRCPDVEPLGDAIRRNGGLFVIDETIGSFANVDCLHACDAVMTSLTKYVSGVGDVIAGSLVLNADSPQYDAMRSYLATHFEPLLWGDDAVVLAANARNYLERMTRINHNAERLADHLHDHPAVESVLYPKYAHATAYDQLLKPGGGYGGLLSVVTKDGASTAPGFYDRLRVSKGPSLGTNYTLACPFTLLAHFNELDWAESLGVSRWLVRVSVGLEEPEDLIQRFDEALSGA